MVKGKLEEMKRRVVIPRLWNESVTQQGEDATRVGRKQVYLTTIT